MANDSYLSGSDLRDFKNNSLYADGYPGLKRSVQAPAIANPTAYSGTPLAPTAAPATTDNGQSAIVAASGGAPAFDAQAANAATKAAAGGAPLAPIPSPLDASTGLLTPPALTRQPLPQGAIPAVPTAAVASSATPAARVGSLVAAAAPTITGGQPSLARTAPNGAVLSDAGRPLGYGQVVNGVRTFSDGSGSGPGAVPRTMSDDQIKALGANVNTISDANFVNPGAGTNGSTPQFGALSRSFAANDPRVAADNAEIDRENAERGAKSDVASILKGDWRSPLGTAAHNAEINFAGVRGMRNSRYGQGQSPTEQAIQNLIGVAMAPVAGADGAATRANSYATDALNQTDENTRQGLRNDAENTRSAAELSRKLDQYQTDPTTGAVTLLRSGVASPVTDASGKPFSVSQNPNKVTPEITKVANDIYGGLPDKDAQGNPIPDEQRWNTALQRASGQSASAPVAAPPQAAVDMLKKNPALKAQFDAKYGKGYSDRVLSNS